MKLANMGNVGTDRLQEINYLDEVEEEDPGLDLGGPEEEPVGEPEGALDLDVAPEGEDDLDVAPEGGPEVAEDVFMDVLNVLKGLAKEDYGIDMSVEETPGDVEEPEGLEPEFEPEEEEVGLPPSPEMGEVPEEEVPGNVGTYQEALVSKVARRVAARLMQENKNEKLAAELTERIFKRITSK